MGEEKFSYQDYFAIVKLLNKIFFSWKAENSKGLLTV